MRLQLGAFLITTLLVSKIGANNLNRISKGEDSLESRGIYCEYLKTLEADRPQAGYSEDTLEQLFERLWLSGKALDGYRSKEINFNFFPAEIEDYLEYKKRSLDQALQKKHKDLELLQQTLKTLTRQPSSVLLDYKIYQEIPASITQIERDKNYLQQKLYSLSRRLLSEGQHLSLIQEAIANSQAHPLQYDLVLLTSWGRWKGFEVYPAWKERHSLNVKKAAEEPLLRFPLSFLPDNLIEQLNQRRLPDRLFTYEYLLQLSQSSKLQGSLNKSFTKGIKATFLSSGELIIEGDNSYNRWPSLDPTIMDEFNITSTNHFGLSALLDLSCLEISPPSELNVLSITEEPSEITLIAEKLLNELRSGGSEDLRKSPPKLSLFNSRR